MNLKQTGILLLIISVVFAIIEGVYFNKYNIQYSYREVSCDIIAYLLFVGGLLCLNRDIYLRNL